MQQSHDGTTMTVTAVCLRQTDLTLIRAAHQNLQPPCAGLIESRALRGADTVMPGRPHSTLPRDTADPFLRELHLLAPDGDGQLIERIETALQAISVEDGVALLRNGMPQMTPGALDDAPARMAAR